MQIVRTFHSVGQGAFYTEEHDGKMVIYDCGGTNREIISKEVKTAFDKGQQIEAVFISHFHHDHINGLETLLKHCKVKRIFLPLLDEPGKAINYIYNSLRGQSTEFGTNLIFGNDAYLGDDDNRTQIYRLEADAEMSPNPVTFEGLSDDLLNKTSPKLSFADSKQWLFIPFNIFHKERAAQLAKAFEKYSIPTDEKELKTYLSYKPNHRKIRRAFGTIDGDLNTNSLTLYSGPELCADNRSVNKFTILSQRCNGWNNYFCGCNCNFFFQPSCMYFGDFDARNSNNWKKFTQSYGQYWNSTNTVQIPHHGSKHSYNEEINSSGKKISIISAGKTKHYRHPHSSTLTKIIKSGTLPQIITEQKSTTTIFHFDSINAYARMGELL